jgi:hypothetical protein
VTSLLLTRLAALQFISPTSTHLRTRSTRRCGTKSRIAASTWRAGKRACPPLIDSVNRESLTHEKRSIIKSRSIRWWTVNWGLILGVAWEMFGRTRRSCIRIYFICAGSWVLDFCQNMEKCCAARYGTGKALFPIIVAN